MADFDGNIKLGISLDIDNKSLNSELSALTKQIKTAFSTVNKNSAEMSSSFSTVNKDVEKVTNTVKDLGSQVNGLSSRTKRIQISIANENIKEATKHLKELTAEQEDLKLKSDLAYSMGTDSDIYKKVSAELNKVTNKVDEVNNYIVEQEQERDRLRYEILQDSIEKDIQAEEKKVQKEIELQKKLEEKNAVPTSDLGKQMSLYSSLRSDIAKFEKTGIGFSSDEDYKSALKLVQVLKDNLDKIKKSSQDSSLIPELKDEAPKGQLGEMIQQYNELNGKVKQFEKTGLGFSDSEYNEAVNKLDLMRRQIETIKSNLDDRITEPIVDDDEVEISNDKLVKLGDKLEELKLAKKAYEDQGIGAGYKEYDETVSQLEKVKNQYEKSRQWNKLTFGGKLLASIKSVGHVFGTLAHPIKNTKNGINGIEQSIFGIGKASKSTGKSFSKSFGRVGKIFLRAMVGVRGLFMLFRKLRTIGVQALNTIASQFPEINSKLSETKTLFEGLKGATGTMIQPLVSAVLPVVNKIIELLTVAAQKAGEFFAALTAPLTGQGYIYKATAAQQDYANSVESTNKALGAYDKLNVIGSDSGGASNQLDVTYNKEKIATEMQELIDMIKESWANADFTEIGTMLGEKLNESVTILRGNILPQIDEIGVRLASSVATLTNGLISVSGLATNIGGAVADALNIVIHFFDEFFKKLDFEALGKFITEGLYSAIFSIDYSSLGSAMGNIAIGIYNLLKGALLGIDWYNLPKNVFNAIWNYITGINWVEVASSLASLFGTALGSAFQFLLGNIDFIGEIINTIVQSIIDYFLQFIEDENKDGKFGAFEIINGLLEGIIEAVKDIGTWIYENIFKPFIDGFKKAFGINSPSTVMKEMGSFLIDGLKQGLGNVWDKIKQPFLTAKDYLTRKWTEAKDSLSQTSKDIKLNLEDTFTNLKQSLGNIFDGIWSKIKEVVNSILRGIETMANGVVSGINTMISALNNISFDIPWWVPVLGGKSFSLNIPQLGSVQLPRLAEGAVIPPNREFMAVLGDQNSGTNIEAPLDTIKQALAEVLTVSNNNAPIVLQLNGRDIAKVVWDENQKRYKQTGKFSY